jgi:cyclic-di-AMP phosphodiesterase PgpH
MKTLHSLTQPIAQLRRTSKYLRNWLSFKMSDSSSDGGEATNRVSMGHQDQQRSPLNQQLQPELTASRGDCPKGSAVRVSVSEAGKDRAQAAPQELTSGPGKSHRARRNIHNHKISPPVMWVVTVVSLTSVMGNRYYNQPKLDVSKAAPQTIRAPLDASVEDIKTTQEKRKAARTGSVPVLMFDQSITQQIIQELQQTLDNAEELRQMSGPFPFAETNVLTDSTQRYLRQMKEGEWQNVLAQVNSAPTVQSSESPGLQSNRVEQIQNLSFAQAVSELQRYRQTNSPQEFSALIESISLARQGYIQALRQLSDLLGAQSSQPYDTSILELSDEAWQETRSGITTASKRILTQGISPGLPSDILSEAVKLQLNTLVPPETEPFARRVLMGILQPNLMEDKEQTKTMAEQAAQSVDPVVVSVQRGEVIVYAGEQISQADFVLLDYFGLSRRGTNWLGLIGFGCLVSGAVGIFWLVEQRVHPRPRRRDRVLLLLLSLSTPMLAIFGIPYTDLPAIGLLVGSFYSPALGVTVVSLLAGLVTSSMTVSWDYLVAGAAGGLLAALLAGRMRSREELALLGAAVGITQGSVYLILNLIPSAAIGAVWYTVLRESALYGLSGLSWSVVALGISPYLERVFDLVTPIRLAELANPNRPLLKRLATEAPGTFQHTLFVASLAEAAARELHCNVELVRAGTLYHDIGKMHDPLGFIENQMGGPNKHDEINNPFKSAEIIKKHVSQGLAMARKHQLPKAVRDFIPEHQGTLLISYFYFQAKQKAEEEGGPTVYEEDFRYDGPIPQSRETGVVMLADACEAALRSLKDVTPETALAMINKILKARWQDNQLADSGLTREDLSIVAEVFVRVWQQCNHQRIAYPKAALNHQTNKV